MRNMKARPVISEMTFGDSFRPLFVPKSSDNYCFHGGAPFAYCSEIEAAFATRRYFPGTPAHGVMRCKCSANFNDGVVKQRAAGSLRAKGQTHVLENKESLWLRPGVAIKYWIPKLQYNYSYSPNLNFLKSPSAEEVFLSFRYTVYH